METQQQRLKRFQQGPPLEVIETLLNSLANFFNNEIAQTIEGANRQTSLLFLGIHSVALTIAEGLFNKVGVEGYTLFLENFVDGDTADTKFSTKAISIHAMRNVIAHQWIGSIGHGVGYDYKMACGWEDRHGVIFINPRIYGEHYLKAFGRGGKIWKWHTLLSEAEKQLAKNRLINKYTKA